MRKKSKVLNIDTEHLMEVIGKIVKKSVENKKNLTLKKKNFMAPFFFMDGVQLPQG